MNKLLLSLGFGLISSFVTSTAFAVESAPITENSKVAWSQIIRDPFDGIVVYDKHFTNELSFVSSWSKQGIRATYTQKRSILTGYRTTWVTHWVSDYYGCKHKSSCKHRRKLEHYPTQVPVYETFYTDFIPRRILFAIAGKIYTYESGSVSAELALALSTAPTTENLRIRLELQDGKTTDVEIGKGTVKAWRTIFSS